MTNQEEHEFVPADDESSSVVDNSPQTESTSCGSARVASRFPTGAYRYPYVSAKYFRATNMAIFSR